MRTDKESSTNWPSMAVMFAEKGTDITPTKDQGLIKVVRRQGHGECPMMGDKVTIHYTGSFLTGKKFDCSRDRKAPFSFNAGKGQVLRSWDLGVLSMQTGEVCTLLCQPEYAYGATGNLDKIPPNSSVLFEIELLKFDLGETLTNDGGLVRRIKVKGDRGLKPNDGGVVDVHLEGSCDGRLFDIRDVSFVVSESVDKGVPLGVDRAMDKMDKAECCILYLTPKYAYGRKGKPEFQIGPDKDIVYEAREPWEMDEQEKLSLALEIKQKGNQYYKAGHYYHAVIQYERIVSCLEVMSDNNLEEKRQIRDLCLSAHLNLALCSLRLQDFSLVVEYCNKVIKLDKSNEKALYRRGEARLLRNEFSLALADFQHVLQVNPANRAARSQISNCQSKIKEYNEVDKRIYANMFQKFAERDTKQQDGKTKRKCDNSVRSTMNGELGLKLRRSQDRPS
ncbi:peptidyl-prolyl cis-trans isomerase FKBP5 isoform X2 [Syngnathus typhle]|uniref:peptidyl-prolyl cis-trans isomerase FKBP5 isoform X2 n=1 Tax=Syngnathus typhle TaxID=161592 RepID=UPI002A69C2D2|nr:peptidyl-prolyl cis-trans isomerase FKBP5 isoform X2 [Syngnathus typhle]